MCRAKNDKHPRRCSCSPLASADHNRRRRVNRQIIAGVIEWAEEIGDPSLDALRAGGVATAARWAAQRGVSMSSHPRHLAVIVDAAGGEEETDRRAMFGAQVAATLRAQRSHEADRVLADAPVRVLPEQVTDGSNEVRVVELSLPDGSTSVGYHKPFDGIESDVAAAFGDTMPAQPMREVAAWHVARLLGPSVSRYVAPSVLREVSYPPDEFYSHERTRTGSLSRHVPGASLSLTWEHEVPAEQVDTLAFFDAVIGNQDRHRGNVFWDAQTRSLGAFDHGYAFARSAEEDSLNDSLFLEKRIADGRAPLTKDEIGALRAFSARIGEVTPLLDSDRAENMWRRVETMLRTRRLPDVHVL